MRRVGAYRAGPEFGDPFYGAGRDVEHTNNHFTFRKSSSFKSLEALRPGQSRPSEPEPIKIFLFGRTGAVFEGGNDFIGHFVMMRGDVMENKVWGGVNNVVLTK